MPTITVDIDGQGIALIIWDDAARSMNVLNRDAVVEFGVAIERILKDPAVKGAVITSGKRAFIAGADLVELERTMSWDAPDRDRFMAALEDCARFSGILRHIEKGGKPVAAAISGSALGGGFELCLACHRRIVADAPGLQVGLPEAKIGLLPGAGGIQRCLRMLGALEALPLLLEGRAMAPKDAMKLGLVDEVVPLAGLIDTAKSWVREAKQDDAVKPWDKPGFVPPGDDPRTGAGGAAFSAAHAMQRRRSLGNYPALDAIERLVYEGWVLPIDAALQIEARHFAKVMSSPVARAMARTQFLNLQKANKLEARPKNIPTREFKKIGVIGAGMMGAAIAHVSAQVGLDVVLIDRDQAAADKGRQHTVKACEAEVARGKMAREAAAALVGRITATTDYSLLSDVQLVVEAVYEDSRIKNEVTAKAEAVIPADAVFATNTSKIPIQSLAEACIRPERYIGTHFFSPVERMALVEVIPGKSTGEEALAIAMDYIKRIRKTPIVVKDSRAFYTSRVFDTWLHEGARMVTEGIAPALIENAGRLAGMPVPPLALLDEVSIELVNSINRQSARDLGSAWQETPATKLLMHMVEAEGRPGRKSGRGFYDYFQDGSKKIWPGLAKLFPPSGTLPDIEELKTRLLAIQALEAARCYEEKVVLSPADADVGSLLGWGFAPWSGGPLSYIDMVGARRFVEICDSLTQRSGERFRPNGLLRDMAARNERFYPLSTAP